MLNEGMTELIEQQRMLLKGTLAVATISVRSTCMQCLPLLWMRYHRKGMGEGEERQ